MTTLKQNRVLQIIHENPRISLRAAMLRSGYSIHTANHPRDLINSQGWKELMERFLPDIKVINTHSELLDASRIKKMTLGRNKSDEFIKSLFRPLKKSGIRLLDIKNIGSRRVIFYSAPDNSKRLSALDMAYRVKGYYSSRGSVGKGPLVKVSFVKEQLM